MSEIIVTTDFNAAAQICPGEVAPLAAQAFELTGPCAHIAVLDSGRRLAARGSVWAGAPDNKNTKGRGAVGHFAAASEATAMDVLRTATDYLAEVGCTEIFGPMDGNTWFSYRLVTQAGDEPPFFMEPVNPTAWPSYFEAAGFRPYAHYLSALNADLSRSDPRTRERLEDLIQGGVQIRAIQMDRFEAELEAVRRLCLEAFVDNLLYQPIGPEQFYSLYRQIRSCLVAPLVLMAECENVLAGFLFAVPDQLEIQRHGRARTVIAKTLAVHPSFASRGLGAVLLDEIHGAARALGYERVIHALIYEDNRSLKLSKRTGEIIRRYTLYRALASEKTG